MALFLVIPIGLLLCIKKSEGETLSMQQTTIINGFFTILIFLSHSTQYYSLPGTFLSTLYYKFQGFHNQWVVATFLAFSGYGVMKQIISGGMDYLKRFPKHRILKTLLNYDIAVILYLFLNILIQATYTIRDKILAFFGLASIGQSNWYIFDILLLYIISYFSAKVFKENFKRQAVFVSVISTCSIVIMMLCGMESRFISTFMCYSTGVWIAVYKEEILDFFSNKKWISLTVLVVIVLSTYKLRGNDIVMNISSSAVVLLFVWFNTFWSFNSKLLSWIGKYAFSIFILQRIPMRLFKYIGLADYSWYLFIVLCFVCTVILSVLFDNLIKKFDIKILGA